MYSLVLMTAMTAGAPETASFCFLFHRHSSCQGCTGACHGCAGSCYGSGYVRVWRGGCHGCSGACYGSCYGSCTGVYRGSCSGCAGYYVPYAMSPAVWGANYTYSHSYPGMPPANVPGTLSERLPEPRKDDKMSPAETSARLVIEVPEDARLYVDGRLTKSGSGMRSFYTPALEIGQTYFYDVRIEVVKEGKLVTDSKRLIVQAGAVVRESFRSIGAPTSLAAKTK